MGSEAPRFHQARTLVAESVVGDADRADGGARATMRTTAKYC